MIAPIEINRVWVNKRYWKYSCPYNFGKLIIWKGGLISDLPILLHQYLYGVIV